MLTYLLSQVLYSNDVLKQFFQYYNIFHYNYVNFTLYYLGQPGTPGSPGSPGLPGTPYYPKPTPATGYPVGPGNFDETFFIKSKLFKFQIQRRKLMKIK
jgi:hypothetical protein